MTITFRTILFVSFSDGSGSTSDGGSTNGPIASAHLSWSIPQYRENGEELSLSDIAGYEIIYRRTEDNVYSFITVEDDNSREHTIENLPVGEYEFMIAVFDTDGLFSDYSEPAIANLTES